MRVTLSSPHEWHTDTAFDDHAVDDDLDGMFLPRTELWCMLQLIDFAVDPHTNETLRLQFIEQIPVEKLGDAARAER